MSSPIRREEVSRPDINTQMVAHKAPLSAFTQCVIGGIVGGSEPFVGTVFNNIKQALQQGEKIPTSARALWSGTAINSVYCASVTAPQFFVRGLLARYFSKNEQVSLHPAYHLIIAGASALTSSVIATPSEMVMANFAERMRQYEESVKVNKQAVKPTYKSVVAEIRKTYGVFGFMRGWQGIVVRDTGFVYCYSTLAKNFSKKAKEHIPNEQIANLVGGSLAGVVGAVATHHFDTWKTRREMGMKTSLRQFITQGHKGMSARVFRIGIAVGIYTVMTDELTELFQKMKL